MTLQIRMTASYENEIVTLRSGACLVRQLSILQTWPDKMKAGNPAKCSAWVSALTIGLRKQIGVGSGFVRNLTVLTTSGLPSPIELK